MDLPSEALVVDDEPHVRVFVQKILESIGIAEVIAVEDAIAALTQVGSSDPGLIMLDVNLRGQSGVDLLRTLRERDEDVVIIMLSSQVSGTIVDAAVMAGADGFIRKNLPREHVVQQIREVFAGIELE